MTRLAAIVLVAAIAACSEADPSVPEPTQGSVFLPIHRPMNVRPDAIIGGRLLLVDGCLVFDDRAGRSLPIWPPGTTVARTDAMSGVADAAGRPVLAVGQVGQFGGGTNLPVDFAEELIGQPIPGPCRVGNYTLVNTLERVP